MGSEADGKPKGSARQTANAKRIEIAGLELCLEHGIENVTVEEIAKSVGISRRTFYRYFNTVNELVTANWMRSLHKVSAQVGARPASESISDAWVYVMRNAQRTDEELRLHRLAIQVAQKSPAAWWQAVSGLRTHANDVYGAVVADRLQASGRDPRAAPVVVAAVLAMLGQLSMQSATTKWLGPDPDLFEASLKSLGRVLSDPNAVPAG